MIPVPWYEKFRSIQSMNVHICTKAKRARITQINKTTKGQRISSVSLLVSAQNLGRRMTEYRKLMKACKKLHILVPLVFNFFLQIGMAERTSATFCGNIRIEKPFLNSNSTLSPLLSQAILCKDQNLYFRTSIGLFPISSINYKQKLLTVSHNSSCSSPLHYISPSLLSGGFPLPPQPNSVLLINCSSKLPKSKIFQNCSHFHPCLASSKARVHETVVPYSCLLVNDPGRNNKIDLDPKTMNCSHYRWIYKDASISNEHVPGTRISFDIPDHVPNMCDECNKPNGNCGVGLKCICHPQECRDKITSKGTSIYTARKILCSFVALVFASVSFMKY